MAIISMDEYRLTEEYRRRRWDNTFEVSNDIIRNVHLLVDCAFKPCPIHNPSDHHMINWPFWWGIGMYRVCPHGKKHPDPDSLISETKLKHVCDGCCNPLVFQRRIAQDDDGVA